MGDDVPDLFLLLGGTEGCVKLATLFYAEVERDPVLRPLFGKRFLEPTRKLAAYLAQLAGGPAEHSRIRWSLSLCRSTKQVYWHSWTLLIVKWQGLQEHKSSIPP